MDQTDRQPTDWRRGCGYLLAGCCLMVMISTLGALAAMRGQVAGPALDLQLGPYHIVSRTTTTPSCHPLSAGCAVAVARPLAAPPAYYTIWVLSITELPIAGGVQEHLDSVRVLTLPIRP